MCGHVSDACLVEDLQRDTLRGDVADEEAELLVEQRVVVRLLGLGADLLAAALYLHIRVGQLLLLAHAQIHAADDLCHITPTLLNAVAQCAWRTLTNTAASAQKSFFSSCVHVGHVRGASAPPRRSSPGAPSAPG
jgi:hypothetical protein